jgi:hypothetical protein
MATFRNYLRMALVSSGLLISTLAVPHSAAIADENPADKASTVGAKDPVAVAFALPKGVVLNADQQAAYDKLKQDKEPGLLQALDNVEQAQAGEEKANANKEVRKLRAEIRTAIKNILKMPLAAAGDQTGPVPSTSQGTSYGVYPPLLNGEYGGYSPLSNGAYGGYVPYNPVRPGYYQYFPYYYYPTSSNSSSTSGSSTSATNSSTSTPASKSSTSTPLSKSSTGTSVSKSSSTSPANPPNKKPPTPSPPTGGKSPPTKPSKH